MDGLAECFRMATCEPKSANQNITAYGVMLFVSDLYFLIVNFLLAFSKVYYIYRLLSSFGYNHGVFVCPHCHTGILDKRNKNKST